MARPIGIEYDLPCMFSTDDQVEPIPAVKIGSVCFGTGIILTSVIAFAILVAFASAVPFVLISAAAIFSEEKFGTLLTGWIGSVVVMASVTYSSFRLSIWGLRKFIATTLDRQIIVPALILIWQVAWLAVGDFVRWPDLIPTAIALFLLACARFAPTAD